MTANHFAFPLGTLLEDIIQGSVYEDLAS